MDELLDEWRAQITTTYDETNSDVVWQLLAAVHTDADRARVLELLHGAFDAQLEAAGDDLPNDVVFFANALALGTLGDPSSERPLLRALERTVDPETHYELSITTGKLAIALAAIGYRGSTQLLDKFLADNEHYGDEPWMLDVRYARWHILQDRREPLAWMNDAAHTSSLAIVAAALADLDIKDGIAAIEKRLSSVENPIALEGLEEALARLRAQSGPPRTADWMIWMFGKRSMTELALGNDNDDVFTERARARTHNRDLGMVYEADQSAPRDVAPTPAQPDLATRLLEIAAGETGLPRERLTADASFDDLELDSLDRYELLTAIERELAIELPEDELEDAETFGAALAIIARTVASPLAPAGESAARDTTPSSKPAAKKPAAKKTKPAKQPAAKKAKPTKKPAAKKPAARKRAAKAKATKKKPAAKKPAARTAKPTKKPRRP